MKNLKVTLAGKENPPYYGGRIEEVKIWHNCAIAVEIDTTESDYPWYPRYQNVSRKEGWTYWEMENATSPELWSVTLHNGNGDAITITTPEGGPKSTLVNINSEDGSPICELFQFYCSGTGRTISIGVNIAPGWHQVDLGIPCDKKNPIMILYRNNRVIFRDILGLGMVREVTVKNMSGKELTYGMSDLLEFRARGAEILVRYKGEMTSWISGHRAYHDVPESLWQIERGHKFNLALFRGKWYHCSAPLWEPNSNHTPDKNPPERVAFLRKLKIQPEYLGKIPNTYLNVSVDTFSINGEDVYNNGVVNGSVAWSNVPFHQNIGAMETYLGTHGPKGVKERYRAIITTNIYLVVTGKTYYLTSSKKLGNRFEVYHVSLERENLADAVVSFSRRLSGLGPKPNIDLIVGNLPPDYEITYQMSRAAGNCHSGTMAFAKDIFGIADEKAVISLEMLVANLDKIKKHRDCNLLINTLQKTKLSSESLAPANRRLVEAAMRLSDIEPIIWGTCSEGEWVYSLYADEMFEKLSEAIMDGRSGYNINIVCTAHRKRMSFMGSGEGGGLQDSSYNTQVRVLFYIPEFHPDDREWVVSRLRYRGVVSTPIEK